MVKMSRDNIEENSTIKNQQKLMKPENLTCKVTDEGLLSQYKCDVYFKNILL